LVIRISIIANALMFTKTTVHAFDPAPHSLCTTLCVDSRVALHRITLGGCITWETGSSLPVVGDHYAGYMKCGDPYRVKYIHRRLFQYFAFRKRIVVRCITYQASI